MDLSRLNERQREAVTMPEESCVVLAGAGSGKTTVLATRIAYLIAEGVEPSSILAVTFTNKAADEMRHRLRKLVGKEAVADMMIGTFHSICNRMLRENHLAAALPKAFGILDESGQARLVRAAIRDLAASVGAINNEDASWEELRAEKVVSWINEFKDHGIAPGDVSADNGTVEQKHLYIYQEYLKACRDQGLLDFNDLMLETVKLMRVSPTVRKLYHARFRAILIDEFQDTNAIQYEWLQLITDPESAFVMAVGDDDQSIYSFRGAEPKNMKRFAKEFAQDRIIRLEQNYRSAPYILEAANQVIAQNADRLGKDLWTDQRDDGRRIPFTMYGDGEHEASEVAKMVAGLVEKGTPPSEIAILYRSNMQSRGFEQELNRRGIPVTVYGGFRFYERAEIKDVLAWLELVCSVDRDVALARAIGAPPRGVGEKTVEEIRQEAREAGSCMLLAIAARVEAAEAEAAKKKELGKRSQALSDFVTTVMDLAEYGQSHSLEELVRATLERSGLIAFYEAELAAHGGTPAPVTADPQVQDPKAKLDAKEHAAKKAAKMDDAEAALQNLADFATAAGQYQKDFNPDGKKSAEALLPEFLSHIHLMTSTNEADMGKKNTVSLMSIHASKGLEFDVVFVTGLENGTFPHHNAGDAMSDTPEIEEERRMMYVAMTRARKQLEISMAAKRLGGEGFKMRKMTESRFIGEIPPARLIRRKVQKPFQGYGNNGGWSGQRRAPDINTDKPKSKPRFQLR